MKQQIQPQPPGLGPARPRLCLWLVASLCAGAGLLLGTPVSATEPPLASTAELATMSLEQLLNIEVTSVSRRGEKLSSAPAAIHVITGDDIRRSGATSIPEALRLSPGLEVGHVDAHNWAVTSRGFNDLFANKLLVLMDGRSSYTPLFSGVHWDVQDTMLEDIERIEVVRGPSAALWGSNAVNGVINIISKSARDTQGTVVSGGWGNEDPGFGAIRFGGMIGEEIFYRVYAKAQSFGDTKFPDGSSSQDSWHRFQTGFRIDAQPNVDDRFTLQGDLGFGEPRGLFQAIGSIVIVPDTIRNQTANVLGRWTHTLGATSDFTLQAYYDYTKSEVLNFTQSQRTFDVDAQYHMRLGVRQALTLGGGYRLTMDDVFFPAPVSFDERNRNIHLGRIFVRDDITVVDERLILTLGSQFEYYSFTGLDYQPTARLTWTPTANQTA